MGMKKEAQRSGFSIWQLLGAVAVLAIGAAILLPIVVRSRGTDGHRPSCQVSLKWLGLALLQYSQDYDEKLLLLVVTEKSLPNKASKNINESTTYGWADSVFPYVKSPSPYHCASSHQHNAIPTTFAPLSRDCTDYWLNARIAGQELKNVAKPTETILLGDGNDGGDMTDARYKYSALPTQWLSNKEAPCYRHLKGSNYCYIDGHVKWLKPTSISTAPPNIAESTFAMK